MDRIFRSCSIRIGDGSLLFALLAPLVACSGAPPAQVVGGSSGELGAITTPDDAGSTPIEGPEDSSAPPPSTDAAPPTIDAGPPPCSSSADCAADQFCLVAACGAATGTCALSPHACPEIMDPVCGCDGRSYLNECFSHFHTTGMAYGGPCRSPAVTPCATSDDCGANESCVADPTCVGPSCAGMCLASSGEGCGPDETTGAFFRCGGINQPRTQACVAASCSSGTFLTCVFTTSAPCSETAPCPDGQVCFPAIVPPGQAAASFCIVP